MVLEQGSTLVVMVTTLVERGRTKCHKYWPPLGETMEMNSYLELTCNKEEADSSGSYVLREFVMRDLQVSAQSVKFAAEREFFLIIQINHIFTFSNTLKEIMDLLPLNVKVHLLNTFIVLLNDSMTVELPNQL